MKKKQFIQNAVILTAVSLFMRAVSFSFNVYIANKIGSAGMGLFALIMSVYTFGVTISASGINLASTKVISEEIVKGRNVSQAVKKCLLYAAFFGMAAFLIIFFGAQTFSDFVGDERICLPLKFLSVSLPCVAMSFALGGYFTATGRVYKSSAVSVIEQLIKICAAVALLNLSKTNTTQSSCICLVLCTSVSEIASFVLLYIVYRFDVDNKGGKKSSDLSRRIRRYGLPVAVSAYLRSALSTTEHALIPKSLKKFCIYGLSFCGVGSNIILKSSLPPLNFPSIKALTSPTLKVLSTSLSSKSVFIFI